jgi:hypothetical protein
MNKVFSYQYDLNYYFNSTNIPNQSLVFETYDFFDSNTGKDFFTPLDFLNLLLWHYDFIRNNVTTPIDVLNHLRSLDIEPSKKQLLIGFILKWYGGYPISGRDSQFNTTLKLIERYYIQFIKSARSNFQELHNHFLGKQDQSPEFYEQIKKQIMVDTEHINFLDSLDAVIKLNDSEEQVKPIKQNDIAKYEDGQMKKLFVFISHSSKDKDLIKLFIDKILKLSLKIESEQIFCTSLEESTIKSGEDFRNAIKENLQKASLVILVISDNYRQSEVCLNEMGAAWVLNSKVVSFIVPPVNYSSVGFIQEPNQLLKIDKKEDLIKFIDEEKVNDKVKIVEITRHVEDFLRDTNISLTRKATFNKSKELPKSTNELGLLDGDIIEINNRDGLYLYQDNKLIHIADDSHFSLHVYGLNRKDRKSINYADAANLIDKEASIPVLYSCKIIIDTATSKKWLSVNGERRFLPNTVYSILVKREGYKLVNLSHNEVMRIPEGDKLVDTNGDFE